jgi:hypothetical protein
MRPTGLGSGFYKDNADDCIYCGERCIGRIYETRTGPADLRWFWALHTPSKPGSMRISNQVATLETTKAKFETNWKQRKMWVGMESLANEPPVMRPFVLRLLHGRSARNRQR